MEETKKEINYKKWCLIEKTKFPKEILEIIKNKFRLELIYKRAKMNKKKLVKDLKNIKREDNYGKSREIGVRVINGIRNVKEFDIPINHWIIHYEKNGKINWNQCARQMIHCRQCGEYISVSRIYEQYWLIDSIRCNCNPYPSSFFDSKYFIPEMWFSRNYLYRWREVFLN